MSSRFYYGTNVRKVANASVFDPASEFTFEERIRREMKPVKSEYYDCDDPEQREELLEAIFNNEATRMAYNDFAAVMAQVSRQFPEYVFVTVQDWSENDASAPGRSYYYFHNGKVQDATPTFERDAFNPEALTEIAES